MTDRYTLHHGDCIDVMRGMDDASVDAIVTDPPYELGFMGKSWDASGIAFNVDVWREALRVLKPGGHLLAFSGSRTYHRMAVAIEDAGFEVRDQIMWIYGSGFPKSLNLKDEWQGWGTALKPAHEPIVVARKPLIGTVAANVLTHRVGALNIDGTRIPGDVPSVPQPVFGVAAGVTNFGAGEGRNGDMSAAPGGRWPANVIHDGSDDVVALFPDSKGGAFPARSTIATGRHYDGGWGTVGNGTRTELESGSAARFFYCAKASKRDRNEGCEEFETRQTVGGGGMTAAGGAYGSIKAPAKNHHPTVKPTELMRYLIRLVTPRGAVVLDPFMGSGSTGKAAMYEGVQFIGIEQDADYLAIANARIQFALNTPLEDALFKPADTISDDEIAQLANPSLFDGEATA